MKLGKIINGYDVQLLSFDVKYSEPLKRQVLCLTYLFNGKTNDIIVSECISFVKLEKVICEQENMKGKSIINILNGQIINSMNEFINWLDTVDMEINNKLWYLNSCGVMQQDKEDKTEDKPII